MNPIEVSLFLAEGFEEIEANTPICFLRHSGISLQTVSITGNRVVTGAHGVPVTADVLFEEADFSTTKMLVLPGGVPGAENLSLHEGLNQLVTKFMAEGKRVSAICAGPMVLGKLGLLKGRTIVCYPGFESFMEGATVRTDISSCVDRNVITANGPGSAMLFSYNITKVLRDEVAAREMANGMMADYI